MSSFIEQFFLTCFFAYTWISTFLAVLSVYDFKIEKSIKSLCISAVTWFFKIYILTEFLSVFNLINRKAVFFSWMIIVILESIFIFRRIKEQKLHTRIASLYDGNILKNKCENYKIEIVLVFVIFFILIKMTYAAVFTVPGNWDSMTYHLSRIMYWIQQYNVNYYYTHIDRQLYSPVLAEYANLHGIILANGDYFVNLLQNLSSYGCAVIIFGILRRLRCSVRWSIIGVLVLISMNIFAVESTTTQVDLVASLLVLCCVYYLVEIYNLPQITNFEKKDIWQFIILGINCGLIYHTKTNALIIVFVFALLVIIRRIIIGDSLILLGIKGGIIIGVGFVLVLPSFIRNFLYVGDILAADYMNGIAIGTLNPRYVIVNVVKNLSEVFASAGNSNKLVKLVENIAGLLDVDINNSLISFGGNEFAVRYSLNMDLASAYILLPFFVVSLIMGVYKLITKHRSEDVFAWGCLTQFLLMLMLIRWQPWGIRLMLPSIVVLLVFVLFYTEQLVKSFKGNNILECIIVGYVICLCLSGFSEEYNFVKMETRRGYFWHEGRFEQYFKNRGNAAAYSEMCNIIDSEECINLGLYNSSDSYQYPILARYFGEKTIENVNINSEKNNDKTFVPDVIVIADLSMADNECLSCKDKTYECIFKSDDNAEYSLWKLIQ